ncbi:hypothetical protein HNY73_015679 [Argiope bruennichi]|uniref:Uncharacterized protein n=1 Tax=Argiope bruennichi TaxID=94029 RepID=A0A8T0EHK8_ARGBR|nr:hypothetical protein HNY73_015679 [Argiope bruennichi]
MGDREWKFSTELTGIKQHSKVAQLADVFFIPTAEAIEFIGFSRRFEAALEAVVYCKSQTPAGEVFQDGWPKQNQEWLH